MKNYDLFENNILIKCEKPQQPNTKDEGVRDIMDRFLLELMRKEGLFDCRSCDNCFIIHGYPNEQYDKLVGK
jgi:hypothetical protein